MPEAKTRRNTAEVGDSRFQPRDVIATRALSEFLDQVPLRPLHASVAKHNRGSLRVLEKCGLRLVAEDKEFSNVGGNVVEGFVFELGMNDGDDGL